MASSNLIRGTPTGALAGLAGGLAMFLYFGLLGLGTGDGFFLMAKLAGFGFFGDAALAAAPGAILGGALIHFAVAILLGILYGWTVWGQPKGVTFMAGLMWGIGAWGLIYYRLSFLVGAEEYLLRMPLGRSLLGHLVFGLALAFAFLPMQERDVRPGRIVRRHRRQATV